MTKVKIDMINLGFAILGVIFTKTNSDNINAPVTPKPAKPEANILSFPRLDSRINSAIDITHRDKIVDVMVDLITCPILRKPSNDMICFNMHCYDCKSFQTHRYTEEVHDTRRLKRGYSDQQRFSKPN